MESLNHTGYPESLEPVVTMTATRQDFMGCYTSFVTTLNDGTQEDSLIFTGREQKSVQSTIPETKIPRTKIQETKIPVSATITTPYHCDFSGDDMNIMIMPPEYVLDDLRREILLISPRYISDPFISPRYISDPWETTGSIRLDPTDIDVDDFMEIIRDFDSFTLTYEGNRTPGKGTPGIGIGADKHCRSILLQRVIEKYFNDENGFIVPKFDHMIFMSENIGNLTKFIKSCRKLGIRMPRHFHPKVLLNSQVSFNDSKKMKLNVMEYFLEKMDPEYHRYAVHLDDKYKQNNSLYQKFIATGHESYEHMVCDKVMGKNMTDAQRSICTDLGPSILDPDEWMNHHEGTVHESILDYIELDNMYAEPYRFDREKVTGLFKITIDSEYDGSDGEIIQQWKKFIHGLTESEIRGMLILFTGSTDVNVNETINMHVKTMKHDMDIHVCSRTVYMNRGMFGQSKNGDELGIIREYFNDPRDSMKG